MSTLLEENEPRVQATKTSGSVIGHTEIKIKGKPTLVPSVSVEGRTVVVRGDWLRTAVVHDEDLIQGKTMDAPEAFIRELRRSGLKADVFTFAQRLPDETPGYSYKIDWENVAAIPIVSYQEWWDHRTDTGVRRSVRKAAKLGVEVKVVDFDDTFVEGIVKINNETPIRQGRPFWHYQKPFEDVKLEHSTYAERNVFLGAYLQGQLIGYMRATYVGTVLSVIQILSLMAHYEKKPGNALIAKAVEVCEQNGMTHLMYCNYIYNDPMSSLTEFKRRNGFQKVLLPRYYIPLTLKGRLAMGLGLHLGIAKSVPEPIRIRLLKMRNDWYARKAKSTESVD